MAIIDKSLEIDVQKYKQLVFLFINLVVYEVEYLYRSGELAVFKFSKIL